MSSCAALKSRSSEGGMMNVRAQMSMLFHLDKCIGCHTCSLACKNLWTDRRGSEYMWWNNVETRPGTGYPTLWEDQEKYKGGWELGEVGLPSAIADRLPARLAAALPLGGQKAGRRALRLKLQDRLRALGNIFYNPHLPT